MRPVQGALSGLVLSTDDVSGTDGGPGTIASTLLSIAGLLFLVTAFRSLVGDDDLGRPNAAITFRAFVVLASSDPES